MIDGMAEARVSFHIGARARARARAMARAMAKARAMARDRASARARARARTSLELGLGLVRVSCIIKKWFKQNSAALCRCPSGSFTGPSKE